MINSRKPNITDVLSPWLKKRLDSFAGLVESSQKRRNEEER